MLRRKSGRAGLKGNREVLCADAKLPCGRPRCVNKEYEEEIQCVVRTGYRIGVPIDVKQKLKGGCGG